MIATENLIVSALLPNQLGVYLENRGIEAEEFDYINGMITRMLKADAANYVYHTFWIAVNKQTQEIVGELVLKGEPVDGEVEIGYRSFSEGMGYATEMVGALKCWAEVNDVRLAAVVLNPASEKVLIKNDFVNTFGNIYKSY